MDNRELKQVKSQLPETLLHKIEVLENIIKSPGNAEKIGEKIAVFDLDNTLLVGDIGDAVFAQLLLDKIPMPFSWQQYRQLIEEGKKREAYERVVTAMAGISVTALIETTRRVIARRSSFLEAADMKVPAPYPHPRMQAFLRLLGFLDYKIYIISATNHYSVRFAAGKFFNLPEDHAFGIKPAVKQNSHAAPGNNIILDDVLEPPVPVGDGKAALYARYISAAPPLLAAGDSETDIPMLNLTDPRGLTIWVGTDREKFESIKEKIKYPQNLFFFQR
ncbi:MAG: haloacid dehalogenase-like hydrolase [Candidatus Aminicenantes bacterium]|nr:haloacid dehalogenase-like hydrolase [Candidatus Aminicenantes bacterium]